MRLSHVRNGASRAYGLCRRLFNAAVPLVLRAAVPLVLGAAVPLLGAGVAVTAGTAAGAAADPIRILALGDSLTAGYGLAAADGFTARLERALRDAGHAVEVINAGVSGDTTAGGRARIDWALADRPDAVIVELGANDMLRGLDPAAARANLDAILKRLTGAGIPTLLAGMYASPGLGRTYTERFDSMYPDLAKAYGVPLYPFFLDGVATDPSLNQADGIHPNAAGVAVIVERIRPYVEALIRPLSKTGG